MRDPLRILARLRDIELDEASRSLVASGDAAALAARRLDEARRALAAEAVPGAGRVQGAAYADWLPRGLALRAEAASVHRAALECEELARQTMSDALASAKAVERLLEARAQAARRDTARREGARLDDAGARIARRTGGVT